MKNDLEAKSLTEGFENGFATARRHVAVNEKATFRRLVLFAAIGLAAFAVRAAEVWCSPDGLSTAAYTEADPGAFNAAVQSKAGKGTAETPAVIHLNPGIYEISGAQGATLFDWRWKFANVIIEGDAQNPGNVVLKGTGTTPQDDGTVVTNSTIFLLQMNLQTDQIRFRGLTFTNFLCSGNIVNFGSKSANLSVEDCVFAGNFGPGSAVYAGTVKGCTFRGNTNAASASLVNEANGVLNCLFEKNVGVKGVAVSGGNLCSNTIFRANVATGDGGAVAMTGFSQQVIDRCLFESNRAVNGGAAYVERAATFRNCRFIGNSATGSHGAGRFNNTTKVYDCAFVGNSAVTDNGVGGAKEFANCVFTNNYAGVDYGIGSSIYVISNCVFVGNGAGRNCGVANVPNANGIVVSNVVFMNNFALTNATIAAGSLAYFKNGFNGVFIGNVATNILAQGSWVNSLVVSNRCEDGGYLFGLGQPVNCTVVHNRGIAHAPAGGNIVNSILVGNEPCDARNDNSGRKFYNVIYGTKEGSLAFTDSQQVDGVEKVGFWWKDDGKQPFWGLKKSSIARDAGNSEKVPVGLAFDLTGNGRVNGDAVDVGCFEWWPSASAGLVILIR